MSTRWTYQVIEIKPQLFGNSQNERAQEELTRAGAQGWELVSVVQSQSLDSIRMFFKKPG